MALPNGYIQLEYIESTGTQYIDTGLTGNDVGMKMEYTFYPSREGVLVDDCLFGVYSTYSSTIQNPFPRLCFIGKTENNYSAQYMREELDLTVHVSSNTERLKVDMFYTSGERASITSTDGRVVQKNLSNGIVLYVHRDSMYLFCQNRYARSNTGFYWTPDKFSKMRLYSCQLKDNHGLVRDFIPCKNQYGEIGLYDQVNSVFYGNEGTGTFIAGPALTPEPPSNLSWSVSNRMLSLSWSESPSDDISGYKVYIDDELPLITTSTVLNYSKPLTPGVTHHVSVVAYNEYGESDYVSVTIYYVLPSAPVDLTSEVANGICYVTWSPSYSGNVSGYKVYVNDSFVLETSSLSYTFEADPGVQYTVSVTAYDVYGESEPSTVFVYYELPNPPTNLVAYFDSGVVHLSWIESTTEGVVGYFIYQNGVLIDSIDSTFALFNFPFLNDSLTEKTMQVSAQDTVEYHKEIEPRTHYTFSITAYDQYGESDPVSINVYYETTPDITSVSLIPNPVFTGESLTISAFVDTLYDVTIT